jgi:hypothetical protein
MAWRDRVTDLLYDGETVRETVDVGANRVYVTSHRVLAFTESNGDASAANFRRVDHPNVDGVSAANDSDRRALAKALLWTVAGVPLVVAGVLVEVGDVLSLPESVQSGGAAAGVGGAISLFRDVFAALSLVDEAVAVVGGLLLALAAWSAVRYARSRERLVVLRVAGDDDVRLPVGAGADAAASELREAVRSV